MLTDDQIAAIKDPCERLYQKAHKLLHGTATIEASVTMRGGGLVVRTTMLRVVATGPDVMDAVIVEDTAEWQVIRELKPAWAKARRARDLDIFKREVQQRSGKAVSPELAQQWADELLRTQPYPRYKDLRAKRMSEAVASHPANTK